MDLALTREIDSGDQPPLYISCSTMQSDQEGQYDGSTMYTTLTFNRRISRGLYNPFVSAFHTSSEKVGSAEIIPDTSVSVSPFEHCQDFTVPYRNETWRFAAFKPIPCNTEEVAGGVEERGEESHNDMISGISWDWDTPERGNLKYNNIIYALEDVGLAGLALKRVPIPVMVYDDISMMSTQELHRTSDARKTHKKMTSTEKSKSRVARGVGKGNNRQDTHNFDQSIVKQLKDLFRSYQTPSKDQIDKLVNECGLSHRQVLSWFSRSRYRSFI
jgi:hypothetical protein